MAAVGGELKKVLNKRKRVSKKSKRSWRKHVDISDIEKHLDEVRRQERTGGIISEKKNDELYFVDKDTDEGTKKESKSFKKKNFKEVESLEESSDEEITKVAIKKLKNETPVSYDLWDSNKDSGKTILQDEHYVNITKKRPAKQPKTAYKVRSATPALVVCHPGASYNPSFEEHQSLLMAACRVEILKDKEIEKIKRQLQLPSQEELAKLPSWEAEMSQGLFDEDKSDESDEEDNDERVLLLSARNQQRKTAKVKRKAHERKREEESLMKLKREKAMENEVFRVKSIKKLLQSDVNKTKERQEKKQKKMLEASFKPQCLGRQKFEETNIEVQLTNEISGNLRNLTPEGNLFEDRFKNLQRRNIIEPRRPVMPHRKYKQKEYEKRSYKNFDLQEKMKRKKT